jgi:hypothetical protein
LSVTALPVAEQRAAAQQAVARSVTRAIAVEVEPVVAVQHAERVVMSFRLP